MFTGLIEETGTVLAAVRGDNSFDLTVTAQTVLDGVANGDSIAINGVCLTVTHFDAHSFTVGLAPETRARTNLGSLLPGDAVNLERSVTANTRMGGHYVQGHVDGTGQIIERRADEDALWITIRTDPALMRYIVTKGYVAIDGTSLTVVDTGADWFNVTLIAYTQTRIILPNKPVGASVNLEVDILAKYVERLIAPRLSQAGPITEQFLSEHGYKKQGVRS